MGAYTVYNCQCKLVLPIILSNKWAAEKTVYVILTCFLLPMGGGKGKQFRKK